MLLRDLDWLLAVAEHEHVTDTAAVLRTSQPTLSRALARVEAELGARVFERAPDGVHLTPTGEIVVAAARDLTVRYAQLLSDLSTVLDPDTGVVRLAFLDSIATSLVPSGAALLPRARPTRTGAPEPGTRARHGPGPELGSRRSRHHLRSSSGEYGWHPLQEERLVLVVPPGHRLRGRKRVRLSELADEELVTTPLGFGHRALVDALLRDSGVSPAVSFESQDLATIEGLVAAGLGVAILPEPFAGQSGTTGLAIAADGARRTIGLTWRTDRPLSAPATRFRDFVNQWAH